MNFVNGQGRRFTECLFRYRERERERERALFRIRESMELPASAGRGKVATWGLVVYRVLCLLQGDFAIDSPGTLVTF